MIEWFSTLFDYLLALFGSFVFLVLFTAPFIFFIAGLYVALHKGNDWSGNPFSIGFGVFAIIALVMVFPEYHWQFIKAFFATLKDIFLHILPS